MRGFIVFLVSLSLLVTSCQSVSWRPEQSHDVVSCDRNGERAPAALFCADVLSQSVKDTSKGLTPAEARKKILEIDQRELSTEEIARLWEPMTFEREFSSKHDDVFWASLIGVEKFEDARAEGVHPVTKFGEEASFGWMAATRRLDEIPVGKFDITGTMVSEVNRDLYAAQATHLNFVAGQAKSKNFRYPSRIMAAVNKYFPVYGGTFRRISLFNLGNVFTPISESEFQTIVANGKISGISFTEMPWSREGKRYGIFRYPPPDVRDQKLQDLISETNLRMHNIRDGRSQEDPIDLAAEFQWRFVQIHSMINANGRTSRALMNRILREFGLPPSARRMIDVDYTLTLDQQKDLVRQGVIESLTLAAGQKYTGRITAYRRGFGNRLTTKEIQALTKGVITEKNLTYLTDLFPQSRDQVFEIGGHKFTLGDDLMFIDRYGIPYAAYHNGNQYVMMPIADKTYTLYAWGGPQNGIKSLKRDLNRHSQDVIQNNIRLLQELKREPALSTRARVDSYQKIEMANNADQFHFYEWQTPLLLDVTQIKEDPFKDPMGVLVQNRGDRTTNARLGRDYVEKAFFKEIPAVEVPELIGHYMIMQQRYYELQRHIEKPTEAFLQKNHELQGKLLGQIKESQEKLHAATRVLLKDFIDRIAKLNTEDRSYLMNHPAFRLVYEYFIRTPLAYSSLAEAQRHIDMDNTVVLRSAASSRVKLTGFLSDKQLQESILGVPFFGPRFERLVLDIKQELRRIGEKNPEPARSKIAELVVKFADGNQTLRNSINALVEYVFVNPLAHRSLEPEMARAYVTQYLHTQLDKGPKETLSTTMNPTYLLSDKDGTYDIKFAWQDATIYILEVPRSRLRVDLSSGFIVQQEVGMSPLSRTESRRSVVFKLAADENNVLFLPQEPLTDKAGSLLRLMRELPLPAPRVPDQGLFEFLKIRTQPFNELALQNA